MHSSSEQTNICQSCILSWEYDTEEQMVNVLMWDKSHAHNKHPAKKSHILLMWDQSNLKSASKSHSSAVLLTAALLLAMLLLMLH